MARNGQRRIEGTVADAFGKRIPQKPTSDWAVTIGISVRLRARSYKDIRSLPAHERQDGAGLRVFYLAFGNNTRKTLTSLV